MPSNSFVELHQIRKMFPGVVALDDVDLSINAGEVHALVGENGAGKSTLMKILSGTYVEYEGELRINGEVQRFRSERDALDTGISIVAQELSPVNQLTIAENVFLGREIKNSLGMLDRKEMGRQIEKLLNDMGIQYPPDTLMGRLSIAEKQLVEIVKSISRDCRILILDEPTSALTGRETQHLFVQIERLRGQGLAIVFISHKLDEVLHISDRISVLRDGKYIGTIETKSADHDMLINMMVGREIEDIYPPIAATGGETLLEVEALAREGAFQDISFSLRKGEILGFAGMMGAGRSEVMRALFGLDRATGGTIRLEGTPLRIRSVRDAIRAGIVMITEDRAVYGFIGGRSITDNVTLPNIDFLSRMGFIQKRKAVETTRDIMEKIRVRAPGEKTEVRTLSGGNQQKVVLSKWLVRDVKVLILDEPTRGIDVGAKQEIYRLISKLAGEGMAVLMISSDMPEVLAMSHRVAIMANGRMAGTLSREEASQDKVMKLIVEGGDSHAE